jgi:CO/xanthine dehydrogenase FAD-binding subunit
LTGVQFFEPKTVEEAVELMREHAPNAVPLGGGTDLVVHSRSGKNGLPGVLIHLGLIGELVRLSVDSDGRLHLGAMVSHAMIEASDVVQAGWPALVDASSIVGSPATRNVGTVGGNLCNGSPAMEIGAPLLVYGARITLARNSGSRSLEMGEFLLGPGRTARDVNEIVTEVIVPRADSWHGSAYLRLGFRLAMEIAVVGAAAAVRLGGNGQVDDCRIALTAVAPTIIRATGAEEALRGHEPTAEVLQRAAQAALVHAKPIDDVRAPASYRREMTAVMTRRALDLAVKRARLTVSADRSGIRSSGVT